MSAMVDLRSQAAAGFKEIFYVVLAEKVQNLESYFLVTGTVGTLPSNTFLSLTKLLQRPQLSLVFLY
jgi:hypothetical protein